ncbi:MAG: DUF1289 domain-containing protein [Neisseria sp.]|uniref:DUF1289 domain-containing protein n=1 Tax=Neisseria sp. TaxID=192066 RepID=UPI0026DA9497|nr:DUF1289 domain-containing protein [Neisseria sp.]MDO4640529.1 DUF1289 domain-containing protein [Neisseria sp.]
MDQPDLFSIPSPCIGVCQANEKGFCKGCFRSREERHYWLRMTDDQKHQVMRLIAVRRKKERLARWEAAQPQEEAPEQQGLAF